ncbi:kinase-like protein, partial [Conidiobolus coronatus NRRL 28638]
KIYAMKTLNKLYILRCKELSFYMQERNVLKLSEHSTWFPKLLTSFQDSQNLYFVMEFAGGGDLLNLLGRQDNLVLTEEETRFYMAEIILAVNDLHKFGYTHRDIKPQNILIDNDGHIKLADFGSCIKLNNDGLVNSRVPVGTSDYISPEVLQAQEGKTQYGAECDWWSVGILMYELLQGDPPFYSDFTATTYAQIMNSDVTRDLIEKYFKLIKLCDREKRIGLNGVEEIQNHPFFNGIDWNNIRSIKPPFLPQLKSPEDTQYFEEYEN